MNVKEPVAIGNVVRQNATLARLDPRESISKQKVKQQTLETSKISGDQWKPIRGGEWTYQRPFRPVGSEMNPIRPSDCRQVVTHLPPAWRKPMGYTLQ